MDIKEYRVEQRKLAMLRDDGLCQICLHYRGIEKRASEVHHVYGRQRIPGPAEAFDSLLCVCKDCHDDVHLLSSQTIARDALLDANEYPTRSDFVIAYIRQTEPVDADFVNVFGRMVPHSCLGKTREIVWYSSTGLCPYCLKWFVT